MDSDIASTGQMYSLLGWIDKNRKQIVSGVVIVVIAGVLVGFLNWRSNQRRIEAGERLSTLLADAGRDGVKAEALLKLADEYSGTETAARALLMSAGQFFAEGKVPEAQAAFERFLRDYDGNLLLAQAKLGIAVCLDVQGKTAEATTAFKEVVDRFPHENTLTPAKFNLAALYEAQGKVETARDLYLDLTRDPQSTYGSESIARLTAMFQKNPSLRPGATAPVNPAAPAVPAS
jgi:predicted negative regulator of RcsB-dependent stress response